MSDGLLDRRGKIHVYLLKDFFEPEIVPPFYQKLSVQQVVVDSIFPHTNPVNYVYGCHVKNDWKLRTVDSGIISCTEVPKSFLEGFRENLQCWAEHFSPLEEPRWYCTAELLVKH